MSAPAVFTTSPLYAPPIPAGGGPLMPLHADDLADAAVRAVKAKAAEQRTSRFIATAILAVIGGVIAYVSKAWLGRPTVRGKRVWWRWVGFGLTLAIGLGLVFGSWWIAGAIVGVAATHAALNSSRPSGLTTLRRYAGF